MWKRQRSRIIMILFCTAAVMLIGITYSRFVSREIYEESTAHLREVYAQVNTIFHTMVSRNSNLLDSWRNYIEKEALFDSSEFEGFVEEQKKKWGFSEFYFLAEDGSYMTSNGERGSLSFDENLDRLTTDKENILIEARISDEQAITLFAVPIKHGNYKDFEYSAIALGYYNEKIMETLSVAAFSGESECFVVYADGRALISDKDNQKVSFNLLDYLQNDTNLGSKRTEEIRQDWIEGRSAVIRYRADRKSYYLTYQPVGFRDWVLVGVVPVSVINSSMNQIHWVTAAAFAGIFFLLGFFIIVNLIKQARKNIGEKIMDIKYREQLFNMLSDTVDDIFVMLGSGSLQVEYVSPNVERLLGITVSSVRENVERIQDTAVDAKKHITKEELANIGLGESKSRKCEHVHQQTGECRWYRETIYHVNIQNTDKYVLVFSDRTNEIQRNEQLKEALQSAKSANEAKSHFLSNMSHDIRTPMNAIVGFATLLGKDAEQPDKVREYTRKITASSQHLLNLINDVLDMSKIESGKTSLTAAEFSIPELMEELYAILLAQAKAKNQNFEMHVYGKVPETVLGDKLRLNQILINLLSNSVKYTQEGGTIELTVKRLDQFSAHHARLRFIVSDNGMGMTDEFVKTVFDPFTREESSRISGIQGTGLGMAITKNIVDLMGGIITVKSRLGEGSTFTVELEFSVPEDNKEEDLFGRLNIHKLLVVDDERDVCEEVKELMSDNHVEVETVTDGAAAPEKAADCDVVLIDWKMPKTDGVETARRIRSKQGEKKPVIILTAYDFSEIEDEAREAGVDAFMSKPFFVSTFHQTIERLREKDNKENTSAPEKESCPLEGMLFLAAEDNELNAEILSEMLKMEGAECELAENGQEAVALFEKSEPGYYDMILMDVQMPVMNGYEATRAIRALPREDAVSIPIIAMTANAFAEDVQNALDAGMTAHVAKPVDMAVLESTLEKIKNSEVQV